MGERSRRRGARRAGAGGGVLALSTLTARRLSDAWAREWRRALGARVVGVTGSVGKTSVKDIARALLPQFGFSSDQYGCLELLWNRESGWNPHAANPSGAYGIPQSLPGSKMASAGADWQNNPVTQIKWGLGYIQDRYGSPCGAWGHSQSVGWY